MSKFQVTLPPIGFPVQWFPQAEIQRGAQAAVVVGVNGQLVILETTDSFGVKRLRTQTRHMSDPVLSTNDIWRMEHGAWDWIPGFAWIPETPPEDYAKNCDPPSPSDKSPIGDSMAKARQAKEEKRIAESKVPEKLVLS